MCYSGHTSHNARHTGVVSLMRWRECSHKLAETSGIDTVSPPSWQNLSAHGPLLHTLLVFAFRSPNFRKVRLLRATAPLLREAKPLTVGQTERSGREAEINNVTTAKVSTEGTASIGDSTHRAFSVGSCYIKQYTGLVQHVACFSPTHPCAVNRDLSSSNVLAPGVSNVAT